MSRQPKVIEKRDGVNFGTQMFPLYTEAFSQTNFNFS